MLARTKSVSSLVRSSNSNRVWCSAAVFASAALLLLGAKFREHAQLLCHAVETRARRLAPTYSRAPALFISCTKTSFGLYCQRHIRATPILQHVMKIWLPLAKCHQLCKLAPTQSQRRHKFAQAPQQQVAGTCFSSREINSTHQTLIPVGKMENVTSSIVSQQ